MGSFFEWMRQVATSTTPADFKVACILASRTNHDGETWRDQVSLVKETGLSRRQIQKSLDRLESDGVLELRRVQAGDRLPNGNIARRARPIYRVLGLGEQSTPKDSDTGELNAPKNSRSGELSTHTQANSVHISGELSAHSCHVKNMKRTVVDMEAVLSALHAEFGDRLEGLKQETVQQLAKDLSSHVAYPDVDTLAEIARAGIWERSQPSSKQKTARGLPRFLTGWFSRAQQRIREERLAKQAAPVKHNPEPIAYNWQ